MDVTSDRYSESREPTITNIKGNNRFSIIQNSVLSREQKQEKCLQNRGIPARHAEEYTSIPREHEGTERDTEGIGWDMSMPLKLCLVSGSLFSETSAQITTAI